ncbi:ribosome biogenesis GTPase Der [Ureaplasma canigenitalium]|uniref:ribosome biogenesis GTPase Der n=1 Tax=Ureaplasma canigenitalium TaxID=42092 RepID=UPI0004E12D55|nr:ribosome biogenesis GTPase Der [Ureaplasma canigenitalium]
MKTVAIVGKPNVGKSSLFNRMIKIRKSIVDDSPGVTRDRIYGTVQWLLRQFDLIDTGGILNVNDSYQTNINHQVDVAINEASTIIFLLSLKDGINGDDMYIAKLLKKFQKEKEIILVVNKVDGKNNINENDLYAFGFGKPLYISAEHGIGIGDLLDYLIKDIPPKDDEMNNDSFKFCIIGRPNVGKSSFVNAILNEDRVIVNSEAGSTRDSIDVDFKYHDAKYTIIDTAGVRRKGKIEASIEKYAYLRTEKAIRRSDLIVLMLDGQDGFKEQDEVIGGLASSANIPTVIIVNKIDLFEQKSDRFYNQKTAEIRSLFKHLSYAPILFVSAKDKKNIHRLFEKIELIKEQKSKKVMTSILNDVVLKANAFHEPPPYKGGRIAISYVVQVKSQIPTFVIKCNNPKYLHFSYARFIENTIRKAFGFSDVPITLYWQDKNQRQRGGNNE